MSDAPGRERSRVRLTGRGQALAGSVAAMATGALLVGVRELWCLAAAGAVLVVGSVAWAWWRRWSIEVSRHVQPPRVAQDGRAHVVLVASNRSSRRSPTILVVDPFHGSGRPASFAVAALDAGESISGAYRLSTARRGVFHLGPIELSASDPFGLARRVKVLPGLATVTVHPRWDRVPVASAVERRSRSSGYLQPALATTGDDFYTLREYVPGDDPRLVHWPSSARSGDLLVRQSEHRRRGEVTLDVDLRASVHDDQSVEAVVSAAASVAVSALDAGMEVRLRTTEGFDSGSLEGEGGAGVLLDSLAAVDLHADGRPPTPAPAGHPGRAGLVVVFTTDRAQRPDPSPGRRDRIPEPLHPVRDLTVSVIFATSPRSALPPPEPLAARRAGRSGTVVAVGRDDSFADAWSAVFGSVGRS